MTGSLQELPNPLPARPPREKKRSRVGCWISGLITLFVVIILVLIGLLLPPFRIHETLFGDQFDMLNAENNGAAINGLILAIPSENLDQEFGVRMDSISTSAFLSTANPSIHNLRNSIPFHLALQSPVYQIKTTGTTPDATVLLLDLPQSNLNTDLLDMYGWYDESQQWEFIPSTLVDNQFQGVVERIPEHVALFQTAPSSPVIVISYEPTQFITDEAEKIATIITPAGLQPTLEGTLIGNLGPGINTNAGYQVMPVIRNFSDPRAVDIHTVETIISNSVLRDEHIRELALLATSGNFDGIFIDYRGIGAEQEDNFGQFIVKLSQNLRQKDLLLGVIIPAARNVDGIWQTDGYNWRVIGEAADYAQINFGLDPKTFMPGENQLVEAMMRWGVDQINRYKILFGLTTRSIREMSGDFTTVEYHEAISALGNVEIEPDSSQKPIEPGAPIQVSLNGAPAKSGLNSNIQTPFIDFLRQDGTKVSRVWLTTPGALRFRMDQTVRFAVGGIGLYDFLADDVAGELADTILEFKSQIPGTPASEELALQWRIEDQNQLYSEITTGIDQELVITLTAPDRNYAINVAVVGGEQQNKSLRSGIEVAVFNPTATPTPTPIPTATPIPTSTPIPPPAAVNPSGSSNPSGSGQSAVAPGAGSIVGGNFEYGGHVTSAGSGRAINAMRQAGMTWMKEQIRYTPGAGIGQASQAIAAAHGNGFKILIGTVGNPAEMAAGGQGYIDGYVEWLGNIAAAGADAIEVWNEPNLDREWPRGQISGTAYAELLRRAFQSIKSRNGQTMVISGAPAPTGAEAAFPDQIMNDNNFLREMVSAGAMQFLDCVGAHYNEGIIPPGQTSGDPRDSYYTRFFFGMLNEYWAITGGQKPICFTELGYLTSEGYPPLPPFFSWAKDVTVAQQAAWLAEAAALASQSGKVRILIIWNVDFTHYSSDPQGGYAIVRPDGSCPACSALAGAR